MFVKSLADGVQQTAAQHGFSMIETSAAAARLRKFSSGRSSDENSRDHETPIS